MDATPLRIGAWRYEPTEALLDGKVTVQGFDTTVETEPVITQLFQRVLAGDLDVSELGLTYLLRTLDTAEEPPLLALPIFPPRHFLHSAVYVNTTAGIERPQDLIGKTVGNSPCTATTPGCGPAGSSPTSTGCAPSSAPG